MNRSKNPHSLKASETAKVQAKVIKANAGDVARSATSSGIVKHIHEIAEDKIRQTCAVSVGGVSNICPQVDHERWHH